MIWHAALTGRMTLGGPMAGDEYTDMARRPICNIYLTRLHFALVRREPTFCSGPVC
jgi:hypothetical protein